MFTALVTKELRAIILSPKFVATFSLCSILILLSTYIGIRGYQASVRQYEAANRLTDQRLHNATAWPAVNGRVDLKPDPLRVFASGVSLDIGRYSRVDERNAVKLRGSEYSEESVYALFRFIDLAFIVQIVLSLFAILFTFDAVSGEREDGTLRLVFSNSVPRAQFLAAKCAGSWLGLVGPISIPIALSLLMVVVFGIPLTGADWLRLLTLLGVSLLFFTFFIAVGVLLSTLTKRPSVSFLLGLVTWVVFVLIIPRVGTAVAGQIAKVPQVAEVEAIKDRYAKDQWAQLQKDLVVLETSTCKIKEASFDSSRKVMEQRVDEYGAKLMEEVRQKKGVQERLALNLSRFSPVSAFQLASMTLAGNDLSLKTKYEDAISNYRRQFIDFKNSESAKGGSQGGIMFAMGPEGLKVTVDRSKGSLDLSGLPQFVPPTIQLGAILPSVVVDIGIILLGTLLAFAGAFMAFLKYDVR